MKRILAHGPKTVGLLGVAFKEHVDDLRESPALLLASKLLEAGVSVLAHDPCYEAGGALTLPRTEQMLSMVTPQEVLAQTDVIAKLHNIELYNELVNTATQPVENLLNLTNRDPHEKEDASTGVRKAG